MMDTEALRQFGSGYVPLLVFACILAMARGWWDLKKQSGAFANPRRRFALLRAAAAIGIVHAVQHLIFQYTGVRLTWWQNGILDLFGFVLVTAPPRFWHQTVIGACFGVMLSLDAIWGLMTYFLPHDVRLFGQWHYLLSTMAGYTAFVTLILWVTGVPPRVRIGMDRVVRGFSHMVLAALGQKLA